MVSSGKVSVCRELREDPLCGDVLPPQKGQDLFLQIPLGPVCLNDDHSVSVCYSASSSWSRLTISIALTAQS